MYPQEMYVMYLMYPPGHVHNVPDVLTGHGIKYLMYPQDMYIIYLMYSQDMYIIT